MRQIKQHKRIRYLVFFYFNFKYLKCKKIKVYLIHHILVLKILLRILIKENYFENFNGTLDENKDIHFIY